MLSPQALCDNFIRFDTVPISIFFYYMYPVRGIFVPYSLLVACHRLEYLYFFTGFCPVITVSYDGIRCV